MSLIAVVLFTATAAFGMSAMSKLGTICIPVIGIFGVVSAVIGVVLYLVIAKAADTSRARRNVYIDNNNAVVDANNQALAQSIEQTKQEIFTV